jgi:PPOX class probable F420-dependent enzyme
VELDQAINFAHENTKSVLVTTRRSGRPQLSNVMHAADSDGVVRISITADRAKYANLQRDPWAALHVTRPDFWAYVVLEGPAELSAVAADPGDATVDELVALYRSMAGEHSDWAEYRDAMVRDRRVVVRLRAEHAYGMLPA